MSEAAVTIRFEGDGRAYQPGETLEGEYRLHRIAPEELRAIEVSVLWYTEGKGDEDLAVHEFHRLDVEGGDVVDTSRPNRFRTVLPESPMSYDGLIMKLRWCVRVRVFLHRNREVVGQKGFQLGDVPPAKAVAP